MRRTRFGAMLLAGLLLSGCYGPFYLVRKVHHWNGQVGDKWVNEAVFLLLSWAPVYSIATLADAIIFNSIEFWTGKNPLSSSMASDGTPKTTRIARRGAEAELTYIPTVGRERLMIQQFQGGQPAEGLQIERRADMTVASNAEGRVVFVAKTQPDGDIVVKDAEGHEVASYSAERIEQLQNSLPR